MSAVATFVKNVKSGRADQRLYRLSEPVPVRDGKTTEYVVVSACDVPWSGPETYIFASDDKGKISDWSEMDGSFRGGLDHERAIRESGWEVAS